MSMKHRYHVLSIIVLLTTATIIVGGCSQEESATPTSLSAVQAPSHRSIHVASEYSENVHWGDEFTPN